jgi:uncharacterized protein
MDYEQRLKKIKEILKKNDIKKAYIFGSFARKEKDYKDIDIAIEPPKKGRFSLIDMERLGEELEKGTKKKIDIMTIRSISPYFKRYIKKDLVAI